MANILHCKSCNLKGTTARTMTQCPKCHSPDIIFNNQQLRKQDEPEPPMSEPTTPKSHQTMVQQKQTQHESDKSGDMKVVVANYIYTSIFVILGLLFTAVGVMAMVAPADSAECTSGGEVVECSEGLVDMLGSVGIVIGLIVLLAGVIHIYAARRYHKTGKMNGLLIIISIVIIFNFPFGTLVAVLNLLQLKK